MTSFLHPLFDSIDRIQDERDLRTQVVPTLGEHFAATRAGIFFFDNMVKQALKRMFRKLDVLSRAKMVAQLFAPRYHQLIN